MGEGYNFKRLKAAILALSHADDWEVAKWEWKLIGVFEADEPETCPCGYHPIVEIFTIRNAITGHVADVGNVCVKRFLGLPTRYSARSSGYDEMPRSQSAQRPRHSSLNAAS